MGRLRDRRSTDVNIRSAPQLREYEAIVGRVVSDGPRRVLDWGCGWGQITAMLRRRGLDVTAFDYRPDAAANGFQPLARYPDIDAYIAKDDPVALPFPDREFDAVLSVGVLEHVRDPDTSLEELKRVLVPGGTLYVYKLPNRYSYLEWIARLVGLYYHGAEPSDAVYTKGSAVRLLRSHGFDVREFRRANMLPLTLSGPVGTAAGGAIWSANRALARVPGMNLLSTNLELVAAAPR